MIKNTKKQVERITDSIAKSNLAVKSSENNFEKLEKKIMNKSLTKAKQIIRESGYIFRIVEEDGMSFVITADFRLDRINLTIRNNKIVKINLG